LAVAEDGDECNEHGDLLVEEYPGGPSHAEFMPPGLLLCGRRESRQGLIRTCKTSGGDAK
jgi:hypothetical protein